MTDNLVIGGWDFNLQQANSEENKVIKSQDNGSEVMLQSRNTESCFNQHHSHNTSIGRLLLGPGNDLRSHYLQNNIPISGYDFPMGFSDDEGSDRHEDFDRSYPGPKARSKSEGKKELDLKKSTRRSHDNDSDEIEDNSRAKKVKRSIFGDPLGYEVNRTEHNESEESSNARGALYGGLAHQSNFEDHRWPKTPGHAMQQRMSSLQLDQEGEEGKVDSLRGFNNFGLRVSDHELSRAASPAHSTGSYEMTGDLCYKLSQNPYELRKGIDRQISSTWLDVDQSGNYDPEEEAKKEQVKKTKAKERKKKGKQPKMPKPKIKKLILKFRFDAIGTVVNITDGEQNWPEDWSELDSEDERERAARKAFYRQNTPNTEPQVPIKDPNGELDDLTGHPIARGCKRCRKYYYRCTMVVGETWPCEACQNDQIDCEPIIEPKAKGKCKRCAETCGEDEDNYCSFEWAGMEPHNVCRQCSEEEYMDCVARPPEGYRPRQVDLDRLLYGPNRPYTQCTNCRATKKRCSLKKKSDKPPCNQCKKAKVNCTFYEVPKVIEMPKKGGQRKLAFQAEEGESSKTGAERESALCSSSFLRPEDLEDLDNEEVEAERESTPEIEMEDALGRKGVVTKIDTCFAHPIKFNAMTSTATDCNFCEMPVFGMTGYFERTVHVLKWSNGLGYSELQGGHVENHGPTTMCSECTLNRLQIIACPTHNIQQIYHASKTLDADTAAEELMLAEPRSATMQHQLQRWCSMCFSIATFKCCTAQPSLSGADDDECETTLEGCGLRLCVQCEMKLRLEFQGNSHNMVAVLELAPKAQEGEESIEEPAIRADVGFLRTDGLLMKNVEEAANVIEDAEMVE